MEAQAEAIETLQAQLATMQRCLKWTTQQLLKQVELGQREGGSTGALYMVQFGDEPIGMSIEMTADHRVVVSELRDDADGLPLAAKACRRIRVGDQVLSVNDRSMTVHSTLADVSKDFREALRPVRVLFRAAQGAQQSPVK